jgi:hypothetical protein
MVRLFCVTLQVVVEGMLGLINPLHTACFAMSVYVDSDAVISRSRAPAVSIAVVLIAFVHLSFSYLTTD